MKEVIQGVCINGDRCCVVGRPIPDDESHDCDAMGCSSVEHVLWRGKYEDETPTTAEETFAHEVTDGKLIATLKAENERLRAKMRNVAGWLNNQCDPAHAAAELLLIAGLPPSSAPAKQSRWISVSDRLPGERQTDIMVTNNIGSLNAHGRPSHCWLVTMIHKQDDGSYSAFDAADRRIRGITHWFDPFEQIT